MHKFGWRDSVTTGGTPTDVWSGAAQLHPGLQPSNPLILTGGVNDTLGGTGANVIRVDYIRGDDAGKWQEFVEDLDMNGAAGTSTSFSAKGCYRLESIKWGSVDQNIAEISATIGGVQVAVIDAGVGQSSMAWFVVPDGKTSYLLNWHASAGRAASANWAECHLMYRRWKSGNAVGGVIKRRDIAHTTGKGINDRRPVADRFDARSVVWVMIQEVSNTIAIAGGFDVLTLTNIHVQNIGERLSRTPSF